MSQALIDAAKAPILAYNDKNWDAVKNSVAAGYVYDEIGTNRKVIGADKVVETWRTWATAIPNSKAQIHNTFVSGNTVVVDLTWKGTHSGPLQTAEGTLAPTGRTIEIRACQVTEIANDKAQTTRHYFDMATMLKQLGVEIGAHEQASRSR